MDNQRVTSLTAIDLSAAFDTVNHLVLIKVLSTKFGLSGKCLKWFGSYLSPREFRVNINREYSSPRDDLAFSVPPSSVADPTLYSA